MRRVQGEEARERGAVVDGTLLRREARGTVVSRRIARRRRGAASRARGERGGAKEGRADGRGRAGSVATRWGG